MLHHAGKYFSHVNRNYENELSLVSHFERRFHEVMQTDLHFNFLMTEKRNQMRDYSGVYHHLDLFIASIR